MNKGRNKAVEWLKNVLIVVLALSAVYLALRTQLFRDAVFLSRGETGGNTVTGQQENLTGGTGLLRPVRMTVMTESGRYGVQYDQTAVDELFTQTASLLAEAVGSAEAPKQVEESAWREALTTPLAVTFDFLSSLPLQLLGEWQSGEENGALTGTVRRMALAPGDGDAVLLYYREEKSGAVFVCRTGVLQQSQLSAAVSGLAGNGARFAFETEEFSGLNGDTLILADAPEMPVYSVKDPLSGDQREENLNALAETLRFHSQENTSYSGADGVVIKNGSDTLRLKSTGEVTFSGGDNARFPVTGKSGGEGDRGDMVKAAYEIARETVLPLSGEGRLILTRVETDGDGRTQIFFDYCLSGARTVLPDGAYAAHFTVEQGQITEFTLYLRTYELSGQTGEMLPELQAQAAALSMGAQESELLLCYRDGDSGTVSAGWTAG